MAAITWAQGLTLVFLAFSFSVYVAGLATPHWVKADFKQPFPVNWSGAILELELDVHGHQGLWQSCFVATLEAFGNFTQTSECSKLEQSCVTDLEKTNCHKRNTVKAFAIMGVIVSFAGLVAMCLWMFKRLLRDRIVAIFPTVSGIFILIALLVYNSINTGGTTKPVMSTSVIIMIVGFCFDVISAVILWSGKSGPYTATVFRIN